MSQSHEKKSELAEKFLFLLESIPDGRTAVKEALQPTSEPIEWEYVSPFDGVLRKIDIDSRIFSDHGISEMVSTVIELEQSIKSKLVRSDYYQGLLPIFDSSTFKRAIKKLGFGTAPSEKESLEQRINNARFVVERLSHNRPGWYVSPYSVIYRGSHFVYLEWLKAFCAACHGYLTEERYKVATNGPYAVKRARELVDELNSIFEEPIFRRSYYNINPITIRKGGFFIRRLQRLQEDLSSDEILDRIDIKVKKNKTLRERLLASDLLYANYKIFYKPKVSAVYDLMALPFVEEIIELKTIQREWMKERARRRIRGT